MRKPSLKRPVVFCAEGCSNTSTSIVPGNHNILDFQHLNSELENCKKVNIRRRCLVGNISMHKYLSSSQPTNLISRHSRISTPNPQIIGSLNPHKILEVIRMFLDLFPSPFFVVIHDSLEVVHRMFLVRMAVGIPPEKRGHFIHSDQHLTLLLIIF
jgi:hypothetical protein